MHDMKVEDLLGENTGEHAGGNLLTVAAMGNSSFLEDLLRAGMDPNVSDAKGRTALLSKHKELKSLEHQPHRSVEGVRGLRAGATQARVHVDSEDHDGATALCVALAEGHGDAARPTSPLPSMFILPAVAPQYNKKWQVFSTLLQIARYSPA
ncbi:hypothetical protein ACP70R_009409 [Stipagrostis hirtigluma subsp. patula]